MIGGCDLRLAVRGVPELPAAVDRHFHVGLAARQPDFADQHILETDAGSAFLAGDDHGIRLHTGLHRGEFGGPFAVVAGGGVGRVVSDRDLDGFSGSGGSADPDRPVTLKNHVITVNFVHGEGAGHFVRGAYRAACSKHHHGRQGQKGEVQLPHLVCLSLNCFWVRKIKHCNYYNLIFAIMQS